MVTEVIHIKLTGCNVWIGLCWICINNFTYSPQKVKEDRLQHKYNFADQIVKVIRMTSQKITINVVRRTCLISRTGFYLRVTDDSIEGSQNHAGDVYSKLNYVG